MDKLNKNINIGLNIIIPLHNKENAILNTLSSIKNNLPIQKFFLIVVENESTDKSFELAKNYLNENFKKNNFVLMKSKKGKGNAILCGLSYLKYDWTLITGADLPFGFSDLNIALKDSFSYDVYLGSKSHNNSKIIRKKSRIIYSNIYFYLRKNLLNLNFKDTQGSHLIKTTLLNQIKNNLKSKDFFIDTEIVYYLNFHTNKIKEIPIIHSEVNNNLSSVKPLIDGIKMLIQTVNLSIKNLFKS